MYFTTVALRMLLSSPVTSAFIAARAGCVGCVDCVSCSAHARTNGQRERVREIREHKQQQQHHLPSANGSFVTLSRVDDLPLLVVGFSLCSANKFCSWQGMKLMVPRFVVGGGGGDGGGCLLHMLGLLLLVLLLALLCFLLH